MRSPPEFFRETHTIGRRCREHILDSRDFPVLRNAPFLWAGHSVLRAPYRMVRLSSFHSHIIASVEGRGRAWIGGKLVDWKPGQVLLAPIGVHHAYEVDGPGPWSTAWIYFGDTASAPALRGTQPQLIDADIRDFTAAIQLLTREAAGAAQPSALEAIVTLLGTAARRLAGSAPVDPRLARLWSAVEADLARDWSVVAMAQHACMSEEHLRRLCQQHSQRSPVAHLTQLRLRRAGTLLRSSSAKLEEIAQLVGYGSVYSFSAAFRRWSGVPPAGFRRGETSRKHRPDSS